jgi:hypothetical protein
MEFHVQKSVHFVAKVTEDRHIVDIGTGFVCCMLINSSPTQDDYPNEDRIAETSISHRTNDISAGKVQVFSASHTRFPQIPKLIASGCVLSITWDWVTSQEVNEAQ